MLHVIWNVAEEMDSNSAVMVCDIYMYGLGKKSGVSLDIQVGCRPENSHLNMWLKGRKNHSQQRTERCQVPQHPPPNILKRFIEVNSAKSFFVDCDGNLTHPRGQMLRKYSFTRSQWHFLDESVLLLSLDKLSGSTSSTS